MGGLALGPESGLVACHVHEWVCAWWPRSCACGLASERVPGNSCCAESYRVVFCDPLSCEAAALSS